MHKAENHAGRLVEVELASPLTAQEVKQFMGELLAIIGRINGKYVGAVSLVDAHVFPADVSESLIQLLSSANPRVERTAFLINESAVFGMQVERIIRSSNNENRRAFRSADELVKWLGDVLGAEERFRLKTFMLAKAGSRQ